MHAKITATTENPGNDRSALVLMLAYVEAECRRLGAEAAAKHAAMAAALVPEVALGTRLGAAVH